MSSKDLEDLQKHTEEMQDIISAPPAWLVRWGIVLFFAIMVLIISLSVFIRYPEIVKAPLKVNSSDSPKPVVSKISGKLVKLLVNEDDEVVVDQSLAYIESTANHGKVLNLLANLKEMQFQLLENNSINNIVFNQADNIEYGELQAAYQAFFQEYLSYKSAIDDGFYLQKRSYLQKDLISLSQQQEQLNATKLLQQRDFELAEAEYEMHKKLVEARVETQAEFRQAESTYLSKKYPLVQTETSLITANTNYLGKQKEILELDNQIVEAKSKFIQALNSLISQAEDWKSKYILSASQAGVLTYVGIVQENQVLTAGQEVFYVNPGSEEFFGEMAIPQRNMGKVREGQRVLVKLKSYPYEEYGILNGTISYINEVPYRDSVFISRVYFNNIKLSNFKKEVKLKNGMTADAEIITEDASLFSRVTMNITKMLK